MAIIPSEVWSRAVDALRPPPVEPFSAWIERVVRLPQGLSTAPGKVTLHPHQRAVADSIGDEAVECARNASMMAGALQQ